MQFGKFVKNERPNWDVVVKYVVGRRRDRDDEQ